MVLYFIALLLERRLFINSTISHDFQAVFQAYSFKHSGNPTAAPGLVTICIYPRLSGVFLGGSVVKNLPAMQETLLWHMGWEDPLEKGTATYSSILAEYLVHRGTWQAGAHRIAKSQTWLKQLNTHTHYFQTDPCIFPVLVRCFSIFKYPVTILWC